MFYFFPFLILPIGPRSWHVSRLQSLFAWILTGLEHTGIVLKEKDVFTIIPVPSIWCMVFGRAWPYLPKRVWRPAGNDTECALKNCTKVRIYLKSGVSWNLFKIQLLTLFYGNFPPKNVFYRRSQPLNDQGYWTWTRKDSFTLKVLKMWFVFGLD